MRTLVGAPLLLHTTSLEFWCVFRGIHFTTFNVYRGSTETRLAPVLLSVRYTYGNLATPTDTGAYPTLMPDDVTTVFPGMQAHAVVSLIPPLVEYTVPVLVLVILLAYHSDGYHVPPSSSLPLLSNKPCWCHRTYTISLTYIRCTTSPYVRASVVLKGPIPKKMPF